jgi:hypothetical protein
MAYREDVTMPNFKSIAKHIWKWFITMPTKQELQKVLGTKKEWQNIWYIFRLAYADYFNDLVFLSVVLFFMLNRIQDILNFTATNPEYSFWKILNIDSTEHIMMYAIFIIVFLLWFIVKDWKIIQDKKEAKNRHKEIIDSINNLANQIKLEREGRDERNKSDKPK